MPVPATELPILEALVNIRARLTKLKKDRSEYIRACDVMQIYAAVIKQVNRLNEVRDDSANDRVTSSEHQEDQDPNSSSHETHHTNNRVDTTLNDVFQLLSLFFLTIGKSRESPAAYCQLATMKQLLDHMDESGVYTETDLKPFQSRLDELKMIIIRDEDKEIAAKKEAEVDGVPDEELHPEGLTKLLLRKWEECNKMLKSLLASLSVLSVELVPIHQRLITIRRQLAAMAARKPTTAELTSVQDELRKIDSKRIDGKFLGPGGASVPEGQAILTGLLEENFEICQEIGARKEDVSPTLQPIYERLCDLKAALERLTLTHRWTLRETDLYNFQVSLQELDAMRVDGKFVDAEGNKPEGQLVLHYLLRRCYGLIYRLMSSSEPISEELMPIANKLSTLKKCLNEVLKYGGDELSPRDLYPYQLALAQIDNLRIDGKFKGRDGTIPEGQAILNANLGECHELLNTLRESMERG
ncbi:hypothetical protein PCANC_06455 [Puccinia coronata f. sp. avenae]|uniref:Uncharacterized protein n=1 Tax=Puccinia coronata f. sp. avenae TaxID=200324 RepID=A0A2N5UAA1_9BASI|nr:hypothetical protein PCANC_08275 [Puccinia coronata f. sp. avenae]PLW19444.1 hypothetical protein PCASD_16575 [Puccinia coronata f. sp. avenae]PLW34638.1 hypothetical protein PCASD_12002 [Puccinia coronata f. sp. avenae]PLW54148.1 hypothetical protein PCANC_06455 [Puccinia coronata f. sp. avenae]